MKNKIVNKDLYSRYIEDIQRKKNTILFEKNTKDYIKNNNLTEKDYIDLINLIVIINSVKIKKDISSPISQRFIYFIFKNALGMDFFVKAKIGKENFLIKRMLSLSTKDEHKIFLLKVLIKKYHNYIYNNFEYIKKLLIGFDIFHIFESKIKSIYHQQHNNCSNKKDFGYSKYFKEKEMKNIIQNRKNIKNTLIDNYNLLDNIISSIYLTSSNFDIKNIIREKYNFNENDINNINNGKINIYAKTILEQKLNISSYNNYTDILIKLNSISIILSSIFSRYNKINHNEILRRELVLYIESKLKMKYNFNTNNVHLYIIIESIESFLYGNHRGILNIIPLFEKIIRDNLHKDNSKKQVFDFLHEDIFINEWCLFKNIYIKQVNIKEVLGRNNKIVKNYNNENDFFSLDIRNKFLHGLFVNENDEHTSAIYTYIFINEILDLKTFFYNKSKKIIKSV